MLLPRPLVLIASAALLSTSLAAPSPAAVDSQAQLNSVEIVKNDAEQFNLDWAVGKGKMRQVYKQGRKRLDMTAGDKEKRMWGGGGTAVMREGAGQDAEKRMWGGGGTAVMREGAGQDAEKRMWGGGGTAVMAVEDRDA